MNPLEAPTNPNFTVQKNRRCSLPASPFAFSVKALSILPLHKAIAFQNPEELRQTVIGGLGFLTEMGL